MKKYFVKSFDDTDIFCRLFDDVKSPVGVVMLSHGMSEHSASAGYLRFAELLNNNGYIVFADDHRAHGLTESDENRGHHDGDIFADTVEDILFFARALKEKYNLPVIYFGHSYGSILGQAVLERDSGLAGMALSGCNFMPSLSARAAGIAVTPLQWIKKDMKMTALGKASDYMAKSKFKGEKGFGVWLTRDENMRNLADTDKLIGVPVSISFIKSMLSGIANTSAKTNLATIDKNMPVALFGGSMDMAGGYGKGFEKLFSVYENRGVKHLEKHLYEGARHNLLNETNRDEIMNDALKFFDYCVDKEKNEKYSD